MAKALNPQLSVERRRTPASVWEDEMRTATMFIAAGLVLATVCACAATDVHWVPAHYLVQQDIWGDQVTSGDLDGDGDVDISLSAMVYWNVGTPHVPLWEPDFTVYDSISSCSGRGMALGDVDSDGDLDLVVTCQYWYQADKLQLYENVGSGPSPVWAKVVGTFDEVPGFVGPLEPSLADIDADGDVDLLVLDEFGSLLLIENTGTPFAPLWSYEAYFSGLPVNGAADLGDLDGDGDFDLVVIGEDSPLEFWENCGTPQSYDFVENPLMLAGMDEVPGGAFGIELLDIDDDGDPDLLVSPSTPDAEGNLLYLNERITAVQPASWTSIKALYR